MDYLFTFLIVSYEAQKVFILLMSDLICFIPLVACAFDIIFKKPFPDSRSWRFTLMFSFRSLSLDTFWVIFFAYGMRYRSNFILLYMTIQLCHYHVLKDLFYHWMVLTPCQKSIECKYESLFLSSVLFCQPVCLTLYQYHTISINVTL